METCATILGGSAFDVRALIGRRRPRPDAPSTARVLEACLEKPVSRRRFWVIAAAVTVTVAILGLVVRNQLKVYKERQARAAVVQQRHALFEMLQPVGISNCQLERFGESNDGG